MRDIRLLTEPFIPGTLMGPFSNANPGLGGICTFVGEVRGEGGVEALELTHYAPLTLPGMDDLADAALERFDLMGLLMVHRVGRLYPGEPIVCVSAAAKHRRAAIEAVDFCMDHLKSAAWFWKREKRNGRWHWIEPRGEDHADLARWK
ncbi:molybdenum cofactor biosynthesis protein MoaE [Pontixanthobacter aestiaquae]|uniref:Molybdopterin synthase catalytic subunit n=1 Tax=Pontixanthobacter aestiaquae TaxID=1509367 RepID=A0A844ZBF8_9SPHN|nr:molybdenum cofactor biosynthesis protein MoaE [Pontixanthobacter aestiaquae]MDN3645826.1 molybdenum cofactor biosynthesis protein MoaE [Pontixanthobacter aestiaquae]MXO83179.1 molybdenum cofactor biosynthesis protein MoaE [Pontixanthobacter aestiaquae]